MSGGRLGLGFWAVLVIVALTLAAFVAVTPSGQRASTSAFGDWTTPVKISNGELIRSDSSEFGLYEFGWQNMTYTPDWGASWVPEMSMGGMIDAVGDTIYRVSRDVSPGLLFSKSTNNGSSWSTAVELDAPAANDGYYNIRLLNGVLFVYGWNQSSMAVELVKSTDYGASWTPHVKIVDLQWSDPLPNDMVYFNGKLYLAYWNEVFLPDPPYIRLDVNLTSSSDMGDTWGDIVKLGEGVLPLIKADSGMLYVSFISYTPDFSNFMVVLAKSSDGNAWPYLVTVGPLTDMTDAVNLHSLSVSSGRIAVAYLDYQVGTPSKYIVRINYSADDGSTWQDLGVVTGSATNGMGPTVNIVGNTLHFCWVEMGTGDAFGGPYPTYYRSMELNAPIPEFPVLVVPVLAIVAIVLVLARARRRE